MLINLVSNHSFVCVIKKKIIYFVVKIHWKKKSNKSKLCMFKFYRTLSKNYFHSLHEKSHFSIFHIGSICICIIRYTLWYGTFVWFVSVYWIRNILNNSKKSHMPFFEMENVCVRVLIAINIINLPRSFFWAYTIHVCWCILFYLH